MNDEVESSNIASETIEPASGVKERNCSLYIRLARLEFEIVMLVTAWWQSAAKKGIFGGIGWQIIAMRLARGERVADKLRAVSKRSNCTEIVVVIIIKASNICVFVV